jgi:hypothetical protein
MIVGMRQQHQQIIDFLPSVTHGFCWFRSLGVAPSLPLSLFMVHLRLVWLAFVWVVVWPWKVTGGASACPMLGSMRMFSAQTVCVVFSSSNSCRFLHHF